MPEIEKWFFSQGSTPTPLGSLRRFSESLVGWEMETPPHSPPLNFPLLGVSILSHRSYERIISLVFFDSQCKSFKAQLKSNSCCHNSLSCIAVFFRCVIDTRQTVTIKIFFNLFYNKFFIHLMCEFYLQINKQLTRS